MRRLVLGSACLIGVVLAAPARAAVLPFTGSLTLAVVSTLYSISVTGAGVAAVAGPGNHLSTLSLPAGVFATTGLTVPITDPAVAPIKGLQLTAANGSGSFVGGAGTMPVIGMLRVCLFYDCASSPLGNLTVPLTVVGAGGTQTAAGLANVTVQGAPWTEGTAALTFHGGPTPVTVMGFAHGPASGTSSTAAASGVVSLVTPILISTDIAGETIPAFGVMTLHFVPEPGTLALFGGGLAALAAAGRRRMRAEP
jgi:hypothetical protein